MKYKKMWPFLLAASLLIIGAGCANSENKDKGNEKKTELTVSAAVSLQEALKDIQKQFEKENPDIGLSFNFGASGTLQKQISQGAPVDLFFSAAEDTFDFLVEEGLIELKQQKDLIGNEIVLIVPKDAEHVIHSFADLPKADRVAIGTPETVPAGKYAKEALQALNIWKEIEGKAVYTKDVRQVLSYVETKNVDAGMVYKTDALASKKAVIVAEGVPNTHTRIVYPAGIVKNSKHMKEAEIFFDYLQSDEAGDIFTKHGFTEVE